MAFYCQNMLEIALILTEHNPMYEDIAGRFWSISSGSPTPWIGSGRTTMKCGTTEEGFFYDLLHLPNGSHAAEGSLHGGTAAVVRVDCTGSNGVLARHPRLMELIEVFKHATQTY